MVIKDLYYKKYNSKGNVYKFIKKLTIPYIGIGTVYTTIASIRVKLYLLIIIN